MPAIIPAYRCKPVYSQKSQFYKPAGIIGYILALINFHSILGFVLLLAGLAIYIYEFKVKISKNYSINGFILFNVFIAIAMTFMLCRNVEEVLVYFITAFILGLISYKPYKFYIVSNVPIGIFAGICGLFFFYENTVLIFSVAFLAFLTADFIKLVKNFKTGILGINGMTDAIISDSGTAYLISSLFTYLPAVFS